jgi:Cys-rich protein (TIGR01571 family)
MQQPLTVVKGTMVRPAGEGTKNAWSSGLCDCTADWCSCLAVWCCTSCTTAQLFTRFFGAKLAGFPPALMCMGITVFLLVAYSCQNYSAGVDTISPMASSPAVYEADDPWRRQLQMMAGGASLDIPPTPPLVSLLALLGSLFTILTVCQVRKSIRKRDGIPETTCQGCEDVCCAACCNLCTQCIIFRHEGMVGGKYSLCSPIGTPVQV